MNQDLFELCFEEGNCNLFFDVDLHLQKGPLRVNWKVRVVQSHERAARATGIEVEIGLKAPCSQLLKVIVNPIRS